MQDPEVLLARQCIYDRSLNVAAYELLFRSSDSTQANVVDGDSATSQVLLNAFDELDISEVVDSCKAYVNFTRTLIKNPPPFDRRKYVIEVLENITLDDELKTAIRNLKDAGYTIALDDFQYSPEWDDILPIVDVVKLDVLEHDRDQLSADVARLKQFNLKLLAEKVETHEMFNFCKELGFELFQGYFLSRPEHVTGKKVSANKMVALNLIGQIQNPEVDVDSLGKIISADPVLCAKLILLVNSAGLSRGTSIKSLQHAIAILGLDQLRSWSTLLMFSSMSDKPHALCINTLVIARLCESLARRFLPDNEATSYFTVGLLSRLDAYFDKPLDEILAKIPLDNEVREALLEHKGIMGLSLNTAVHHDHADWDNIDWPALENLGVNSADVEDSYLEAIKWASRIGLTIYQT